MDIGRCWGQQRPYSKNNYEKLYRISSLILSAELVDGWGFKWDGAFFKKKKEKKKKKQVDF